MFDRKSYKWIYFIDNLIYKKKKIKKQYQKILFKSLFLWNLLQKVLIAKKF